MKILKRKNKHRIVELYYGFSKPNQYTCLYSDEFVIVFDSVKYHPYKTNEITYYLALYKGEIRWIDQLDFPAKFEGVNDGGA